MSRAASNGYSTQMEFLGETIDTDGAHDRASLLQAAVSISGHHIDDLWTDCISIDGSVGLATLRDGLAGSFALNDHQYNVVAQALNDRFADMDLARLVPYANEI